MEAGTFSRKELPLLKKLVTLSSVFVFALTCIIGMQFPSRALGGQPTDGPHAPPVQPSGLGGISPNPRPIVVKQPDGTSLKLWFQGSPFYSWYEDEQGYTVLQ